MNSQFTPPRGEEAARLDSRLAASISDEDRARIWESARRILETFTPGVPQSTMALGYVQSGKTTSMSALSAAACDANYRIVVVLLGTTNLLLDQNRKRLKAALGIDEHNYKWISTDDVTAANQIRDLDSWLSKGRTIFMPILKHYKHIDNAAKTLGSLQAVGTLRTLIIDDEADQASLNTRPDGDAPSKTYEAIIKLRNSLPNSLYVQYTATPYAPLLLDPSDPLMPTAVEFLVPGHGYTGGREFLIEHAGSVVRTIPYGDESTTNPISKLPASLERACAAFIAGAAILYSQDRTSPPISMLVHATNRNDIQARYHFLLERLFEKWRDTAQDPESMAYQLIEEEARRLVGQGVQANIGQTFWPTVQFALDQTVMWLVNSATDLKKISWNYAPFHILVGGNKLDRGFTVEGLTVSYMNRKPSDQIDTLEQRARAFGYRSNLLPFCQLFATNRTLRVLRGVVHTEDDLRANLRDWLDQGGAVANWAEQIGLDIPAGAKPTRSNVIRQVQDFNASADWHVLRRPLLGTSAIDSNRDVLGEAGLFDAPFMTFGRLSHRVLELPIGALTELILDKWKFDDASPSWRHAEIVETLRRHPRQDDKAVVALLGRGPTEEDRPRERAWQEDIGFINIFQGRDLDTRTTDRYEGDKTVGPGLVGEEGVVLQVHFVQRRGFPSPHIHTLAIHLGDRKIVKASTI